MRERVGLGELSERTPETSNRTKRVYEKNENTARNLFGSSGRDPVFILNRNTEKGTKGKSRK